MLSSGVTWLADGYKPKIAKDEKDQTHQDTAPVCIGPKATQRKYPQPFLTSGRSLGRKSFSANLKRSQAVAGAGVNQSASPHMTARARSAPSGLSRARHRPGSAIAAVQESNTVSSQHQGRPDTPSGAGDGVLGNTTYLTTTSTDPTTGNLQQHQQRPHSAQSFSPQHAIDLYSQPLAARNVNNPTFRLYIYHTPSGKDAPEAISSATRPYSARMRVARSAARPLGKPRSAWEVEHEADEELWYPLNIVSDGGREGQTTSQTHPSPAESETNLADLNLPPFHTSADSDRMQLNQGRPFSSCSDRADQAKQRRTVIKDLAKRPVSSCEARRRRDETGVPAVNTDRQANPIRSASAGPVRPNRRSLSPACHYSPAPMPRTLTPTPGGKPREAEDDRWDDGFIEDGDEDHTASRAASPWLEDPRVGLSVGFEADPRLVYFDQRHARCLSHSGHTHVSASTGAQRSTHHHSVHPLMMLRPSSAGAAHSHGETRSVPGSINSSSMNGGPGKKATRRPWSSSAAMSRPSSGRAGRYYSAKQRYVDVHRPQTAPSTRKELQKYGASAQRGYLPHYCNFVRSVNLHARPNSTSTSTNNIIITVDDSTDDGYNTNTDVSHTETDQDKQRQVKSAPPPLTGPSLTTRAGSPSSTGYDPESLLERLQEQGLAGSMNALDDTANDSNEEEEEIPLDDDFRVEDESENGNSREITTQTPVQEIRVTVASPAPGPRLPIQIPGPDEKQKEGDVDQTDSARSKEDQNPVDLVEQLTSSKNKEPSRKPVTPTSGSKSKGRTPCVKKEKVFGKDKKKKGKKKETVEKRLDSDDQKTQVSEHKDDPVPEAEVPPAEPIIVEAKAPDLPAVDVPDSASGSGKGKRKKSTKKLISASKPVEKAKTNMVKEDTPHSFYDFGDLETTKAELEDVAAASKAAKVPSYLNDRMVLSLQSSRFELPMDMKSLEKMSPADYLRKYCVISTRRKTLYQKIFQKHRERSGILMGKSTVCRALQEVLVNALKQQQLTELCDILQVLDDTAVDLKLFSGMAALAERILYPEHLTEDTAECTEYHREKVECADFCSLQWKLHGVQISPPVKKILEALG